VLHQKNKKEEMKMQRVLAYLTFASLFIVFSLALVGCGCLSKVGTKEIHKTLYQEVDGNREFILGAPFNVADQEITLPLQSKRKINLGGAVFHVERVNNRLIVMALTGLYAIDSNSGEKIWKFDQYRGATSKILIHQNTIYFSSFNRGKASVNSTIHVLDLKSGKLLWEYKLPGGQFTALSRNGDCLHAILAVPNERTALGGLLVTLNAKDGSLLWTEAATEEGWVYTDSVRSHGVFAVVMSKPKSFGKLEMLDSALKMTESITRDLKAAAEGRPEAVGVPTEDQIKYRIYEEGQGRPWNYKLIAYDASNGKELWRREVTKILQLGTQISELHVTSDGLLFPLLGRSTTGVASDTIGLAFAVNAKTGEVKWERSSFGGSVHQKYWPSTGYLASDRYLYGYGISSEGAASYLMCADVTSGVQFWREVIKSGLTKQFMQNLLDSGMTSVSQAWSEKTGGDYYKVHYNPYAHKIKGDVKLLCSHYGIFVIFSGDNRIRRYIGGKELWSHKHKAEEPIMPNQITRNYLPLGLGDESGKVQFINIMTGKVD
jgi:outer membrane protein assembly factor BamB